MSQPPPAGDKTQKKPPGPAVSPLSAALFQEPCNAAFKTTPRMRLYIPPAPHFLGSCANPQFLGSLPQRDTVSHRSLSLMVAESAWAQPRAQPKRGGMRQPLLFRPTSHLVCLRGRGLPAQGSLPVSRWKAIEVGPYSPRHLLISGCVPRPSSQGDGLVGAPRLVPGTGRMVGTGQTDSPPRAKLPVLLPPPPPSCPRVFNQQNHAGESLPKAAKCLWQRGTQRGVGGLWLCQRASGPGGRSGASPGSCRSGVLFPARQWEHAGARGCSEMAELCRCGRAGPWPGSSLGAWQGEVGSHLPPPRRQQWVCRESSPVAVALLCHGSPGRWAPWQTGPC